MHYRLSRSLWVLGPVLYLAGAHLHAELLVRLGALGTLMGLFYGYWPRTSRRTVQVSLDTAMATSVPTGPPLS